MTPNERELALTQMRHAADMFYSTAIHIRVHPFIEFAGLLNQYIQACQEAHKNGIDFTACSRHTGSELPMESHMVDYVNEKLECIFTGRVMMKGEVQE